MVLSQPLWTDSHLLQANIDQFTVQLLSQLIKFMKPLVTQSLIENIDFYIFIVI